MLVSLSNLFFLEQNLIHRKEIVAIILEDLENLEIFYYFEVVGESEVEECF